MYQQHMELECLDSHSLGRGCGPFALANVKCPPRSKSAPACRVSYFLFDPIMTLETKLTMALAGCSGSCSANRWHMFSVPLWDFLATKPKILEEETRRYTVKSRVILTHLDRFELL